MISVTSSWLVHTCTLALIFILLVVLKQYAKYKLSYWKRRGVETPPVDLIFGNFKDAILFRTSPGMHMGTIYKSAKPDAPYFGFYIFHKPCFMIRDPELMKQMFIRDQDNFSNRNFGGVEQRDSLGMKNLFGLRGEHWKYLRSKVTPTMSPSKMKQMYPLIVEAGKPIKDYLCDQPTNGNGIRMIDAQDLSEKYTTDLMASIACGTNVNSFVNPEGGFTKAAHDFLHGFKRMVALVNVFFLPEVISIFGTLSLYNFRYARKLFWKAIESRERDGGRRGDYIDTILQFKNGEQNPEYKFEGENLVAQSSMIISGFESSATLTSFILLDLANNPECQERARRDIEDAISQHGVTYTAFQHMKYLDLAINESLRLHPPVTVVDRSALQDYKVPGTDLVLEKGTAVYAPLYGLHEDPRFFPNPEVFDPDRFANDKISDAYIPFGIGPRKCTAPSLGVLPTKVAVVDILRNYELSQNIEQKTYPDTRSTFTIAQNGIHLNFKRLDR